METHNAITKDLMFKDGEECIVSFRSLLWFDAKDLKEVKKNDFHKKDSGLGVAHLILFFPLPF